MIENEITTSEHLLEVLHPMARDPILEGLPYERERELEELLDEITKGLFDGLESFHQPDYGSVRARFGGAPLEFIMQQMDYQFSRDLLKQIPKYVERFLELDELWGTRQPSRRVASLLREATRCYVFGFWQASIALSRAAIEEALRERVVKLTNQPTHKLGQLIDMAQRVGLLDHDHIMMANAVKRFGDEVLHGTETWSGNAKEAVISARGVLEHLHR